MPDDDRHDLTGEERRRGGVQSHARRTAGRKSDDEARLRAWHVESGHTVKDPTPEEQAIIEAVRRRLRGSR